MVQEKGFTLETEERQGNYRRGISNFNLSNHRRFDYRNHCFKSLPDQHPQLRYQQHHKYPWQRILRNERGATAVEALIVTVIMVFLAYSGVEYWATLVQHQQASHLLTRYLQRMSIEGRLSAADETTLTMDFSNIGLTVESIVGSRESQGNPRVLRDPANLAGSVIGLKISSTPLIKPVWTGTLIGGGTGDGKRIVVGGEILSERINP
ncbi:MAG: TadE/TadG family type IV pilus assembly protein [Bacillota bacterium]